MVRRSILAALAAALLAAGPIAAAEPWRLVNERSFYPEGPLWSGGRLLYVEYAAHTVMAWDGERNAEFWRSEGCGPAALAPYAGGLLVTCYDANTLVVIGPDGRVLRTIGEDAAGAALLAPNDLAEDGKGGLYVSLSGVYDAAAPIQGEVSPTSTRPATSAASPTTSTTRTGWRWPRAGGRCSWRRCWRRACCASRSGRTARWASAGSSPG